MVGNTATKDRFLHCSFNVSWAKGEIVVYIILKQIALNEWLMRELATMSVRGVADGAISSVPSPAEYVVTMKDILIAKFSVKMVVISSCYKPKQEYLRADHIFIIGCCACAGIL